MFRSYKGRGQSSTIASLDVDPLGPLSDSSLNGSPSEHNGLKKRKRESLIEHHDLGKSFTILEPSPTDRTEPLTLVPHLLIPRSCLPLAYLDLDMDLSGAINPRLFTIGPQTPKILAASVQEPDGPRVLIGERHDNRRLYAVEHVWKSVHALCRLGDWIRLEDFEKPPAKARKTNHGDYVANTSATSHMTQWWSEAAVDFNSGLLSTMNKDHRLKSRGIRLTMAPPPFETLVIKSVEPGFEASAADMPPIQVANNTFSSPADGLVQVQSTEPVDVSGMIKVQYLESLYINKTSLAYFAKGPVSRARAAAQGESPTIPLPELIEVLREAILSVSISTKKYSEILPKIVEELPIGMTSEDEDSVLAEQIRKSKKRKKITKGGLFPSEEQYTIKWWLNRERVTLRGGPGDTREQRIKESLIEQRARETQLQIILVLEVLALEAAATSIASTDNLLIDASQGGDEKARTLVKRPKKPLDLLTLLDILIDRLSIWHSTSQEQPCEEDQSALFPQGKKLSNHGSDSDRLRDFCTEVVVPFYATRLPELYSSICRKLGGSVVPSPVRASKAKPSVTHHASVQPDAALQRAHPLKSRKPLERFATDNKMTSRRPYATLTRSATDSALPSFKRELSGMALSAIPISRPSLHHSKRYSQREVDLTAVSQATEAKLQKKAAIEQELQGAIAAMKRPNPRAAVKELVDASDRRAAVGTRSRKSKNPIWNPLGQSIQVMATPKINRRRNVFPNLPRQPQTYLTEPDEPEAIPPSSDRRIPSSSTKPPAVTLIYLPEDNSDVKSTVPHGNDSANLSKFQTLAVTPSRRPSAYCTKSSQAVPFKVLREQDEAEDELSQDSPALLVLSKAQLQHSYKCPSLPNLTSSFDSPRKGKMVHETPTRKALPKRWAAEVFGTPKQRVKWTPDGRKGLRSVGETKATPAESGNGTKTAEKVLSGVGIQPVEEVSIYQSLGWDDNDDELM